MESTRRRDPRVARTRQLIKDAFVKLLEENSMDKISVNRISQVATINRVTFYLHYKDMPDMLEKMADDMENDIRSILEKDRTANQLPISDTDKIVMENLFHHISENFKFYRIVLTTRQTPIFKERLSKLLTELIVKSLNEMHTDSFINTADIKTDILVWYISSASIGTIVAWLENDMPYTPHFLAEQFFMLMNQLSRD